MFLWKNLHLSDFSKVWSFPFSKIPFFFQIFFGKFLDYQNFFFLIRWIYSFFMKNSQMFRFFWKITGLENFLDLHTFFEAKKKRRKNINIFGICLTTTLYVLLLNTLWLIFAILGKLPKQPSCCILTFWIRICCCIIIQ